MQKVTVNGKTYRVSHSCIDSAPKFDRIRKAFAARGIADHVNALAPRARNRYTQLFIMQNGSAMIADSRIEAEVARECSARPPVKG